MKVLVKERHTVLRVTLSDEETIFVVGRYGVAGVGDVGYTGVLSIAVYLDSHSIPTTLD